MNQLGWILTYKLANHSLVAVNDIFPETYSLILSHSVLCSFLETYCQALKWRFWIELSEGSISIRELWSPVALLIKFGDITESQNQLGWTRLLSSSSPTSDVTLSCQPDLDTKCHLQSFLEHLRGQWLHHLPALFIPMFNYSFCEEIPSHVQPELPLAKLLAIFSCPVPSCLGEEAELLPHYKALSGSCREQ